MSLVFRYRAAWPVASLIGGVATSFLVVYLFMSLKNTYATLVTFGLMLPFALFILGGTRKPMLAVLTVCLPVTVDFTFGHAGHLSGSAGYIISVFDIVLAILCANWFMNMLSKRSLNIRFFPSISVPAILLMGLAVVSMANARFPELSKFELIEMVKMYFAFLYFANNIEDEGDVKFIVGCLIAGLLFEGFLGYAQHRYSEPFWPTSLGGPHWIDSRISGTWISYNDFAWYLTLIMPLALSMLLADVGRFFKAFSGAAFLVAAGSLMWSSSRGGWISFAVAVLFVAVFAVGKIRGRYNLAKTMLLMMTALLFMSPLIPRLTAKLNNRLIIGDKGSAQSRLPQFEVAGRIIMAHPLSGIGLNNYTEVMHDYDTTGEGLDTITRHAVHNIFLLIAAEVGIFGLFVFLWWIVAVFVSGMKKVMREKGVVSYATIGLMGGIVAFLVHGLVDTASLGNKLYMFVWVFSGIIAAGGNTKELKAKSKAAAITLLERGKYGY